MEGEMGKACDTWERREMNTKFCLENLKGRDDLGDLGIDGRII
jgi:hypothetical protein